MRPSAAFLLVVASILYANLGYAIFADEAYQTDYHHALLGLPQAQATLFHRPSPVSKASLLYTLSEKLVLGAVNPKDGTIIWRQQLADQRGNGTTSGLLCAGEGGDTLVTAVGDTVSSWDATDGRLSWQWKCSGRIKSLVVTEGRGDILVLSDAQGAKGLVQKLAADSGALVWEYRDSRYV